MNRRIIQSPVFLILTMWILFSVIIVPSASAEFYVIAGSRGVGTEIRSLPYTISSPGLYYITKDLTCVAGVHGITITANNVTLDLMGFSLIGPGGTGSYDGIYMNGRSNVEIRNGTVREFLRDAIREISVDGTGHRIVDMRIKENGSYGINLGGKSHIVERCTALGNGATGMSVGRGSTVTGSTCYENDSYGISTGFGSTVTDNTCYSNVGGISTGSGSTVTCNTCHSNTVYGIYLGGYNLVDQNTALNNETNMTTPEGCWFGANVAP